MQAQKTAVTQSATSSPEDSAFRRLFHHHPIPTFVCDLTTLAILDVNSSATRKYGYSRAEFLAMTIDSIFQPKDASWSTILGDTSFAPSEHSGPWHHKLKNGSIIPVAVSSRRVTYADRQAALVSVEDINERIRVGNALLASEVRYRRLFASAKDGILILDADSGIIEDVNPYLADLLGYPINEILGKEVWEISVFKDIIRNRAVFEKLQTEKYVRYENLPLETSHGHPLMVEFVSNVYEAGGRQVIQCNIRDITQRRLSEQRLRLLNAAFNAAGNAILITDRDATVEWANPAWTLLTGFSVEETIGKHPRDLVHSGENTQAHYQELWDTILSGRVWHGTLTNRRKDASLYREEQTITPVLDESGRVTHFIAIKQDITRREENEEILRLSEQRLRLFYESDLIGVFYWDTEGRITEANDKFLDLVGFTREAMHKGEIDWRKMSQPDMLAGIQGALAELKLKGVNPHPFETTFIRKDGRKMPIMFAGALLDESRTHGVGFILDISELKRSEEARNSLQTQLQQAQKLESLGTLASGIAHDFNNILSIILGHSEILGTSTQNPGMVARSLGAITKATARGAGLVKQLLMFARQHEPLQQSVQMNHVISEIVFLLKETLPRNITVSASLQQQLPTVVGDPNNLHQVMLNLCLNARDAMPQGGTLSLSTSVADGATLREAFVKATARQYVVIRVEDSGIGMDNETRLRIFEPFFTTKEIGKGTGLGLPMVFGIVEKHNGFIDVKSVRGKGSTFDVYFPTRSVVTEATATPGMRLEDIPGGSETILLIEDEETILELAKATLQAKGYSVLTAMDGSQGVEQYLTHRDRISLVLTDLGLPTIDGREVFRRIQESNPRAKIVVASGFIEPEVKLEMFREGLKRFIQKPYLREDLLITIRETLDAQDER